MGKKLNRRQLRHIILNEIKRLNEEDEIETTRIGPYGGIEVPKGKIYTPKQKMPSKPAPSPLRPVVLNNRALKRSRHYSALRAPLSSLGQRAFSNNISDERNLQLIITVEPGDEDKPWDTRSINVEIGEASHFTTNNREANKVLAPGSRLVKLLTKLADDFIRPEVYTVRGDDTKYLRDSRLQDGQKLILNLIYTPSKEGMGPPTLGRTA